MLLLLQSIKPFGIISTSIALLMCSSISLAHLSDDVTNAMNLANSCAQTSQNYMYTECMQDNNERIKQTALSKSQQQIQNYPTSKRQTIIKNINAKIKTNSKHCSYERDKFVDNIAGTRRYQYCLYENMLELLINVERNIEIYTR